MLKDDFQSVKLNYVFFCFDSCKTSQNVTLRNYLHEVNSTAIMVTKLYASFVPISLDKSTQQLFKSKKMLQKEFKMPQREYKQFITNNRHRFTFNRVRLTNIGVLRLRSTDWRSSLSHQCTVLLGTEQSQIMPNCLLKVLLIHLDISLFNVQILLYFVSHLPQN